MIDRVRADRLSARIARDPVRVGALDGLLSALEEATRTGGGDGLDASDEIAVLRRERKRRTEAADSFREGQREADAQREEAEGRIIEAYLPAELGGDELAAIVDVAIAESGATTVRDLGAVMKLVLARTGGRADGKTVSDAVRARLGA